MNAGRGAAGAEFVGLGERRRGLGEFEKTGAGVGRGAVGFEQLGVGEQALRPVEARAGIHVALGHAARVVHGEERDAIELRRRHRLDARGLEKDDQHEQQAEHAEQQQDGALHSRNAPPDARVDDRGERREHDGERGEGPDGQDRIEDEIAHDFTAASRLTNAWKSISITSSATPASASQ